MEGKIYYKAKRKMYKYLGRLCKNNVYYDIWQKVYGDKKDPEKIYVPVDEIDDLRPIPPGRYVG